MLLSIIVYGFMIVAFYFLFKVKVQHIGQSYIIKQPYDYKIRYWLGIFICVFFLAVRWDVGRDYFSYLGEYISILRTGSPYRFDIEIGFVVLMGLFAKSGLHFTFFYAAVAFIQVYFTLTFFRHEKYLLSYFMFAVMTANTFFMWSNIMRHTIVIALFLYVSMLMMEKKRFYIYALIIALMTTIHFSAILLLPLYFLFYIDLKKFFIPRILQFILFFAALILASLSIWQYLLGVIDFILSAIGYDRYSSELLLQIGGREMNFGARRFILCILDVILICYSRSMRSAFPSKTYGFVFILFVVYYTFMPIFMDNMALSRLFDYFQIGRVLMISYFLFYVFDLHRNERNFLMGIVVVALLLGHLFIQIYSDNGLDCIRYQFCFGKNIPILI